jgi:predicted phage terminase large subunit-like protein
MELVTGAEAELTRRAEHRLRTFIRTAWPILEPATPFINGWCLDAVSDHLEAVSRGQIRNLIINIPPRHMKSLSVSVFWPVWEWVTKPHLRYMFASYSLGLALRDNRKARRIIEHEWFQERWGDRFQLASDQNTVIRYENDALGFRQATAPTAGMAMGEGGDRVVCDDPHNVMEVESQAVRENVLMWWDQQMSTRLNNIKTGVKIIVMQRLHERDLAGHGLKQGGYEHLLLPEEYDPKVSITTSIGWKDPRKVEGELLWPERLGPPELAEAQKRLGPTGYAGQYQQRPAPAGGSLFKLVYFANKIITADRLPKMVRSIRAWDFAATQADGYKTDPDWTVGVKLGQDERENVYVLDVQRIRGSPGEVASLVKTVAQMDGQDVPLFIDEEPGASGKSLTEVYYKMLPGYIIWAEVPGKNKEVRAHPFAIACERGVVYILQAEWNFVYFNELQVFPNGEHDDQVDASSGAYNNIFNVPVAQNWQPAFGSGLLPG